MSRTFGHPSSRILCFLFVLFVQFLGGISGGPSNSKEVAKSEEGDASGGGRGLNVLLICLGVVAAAFTVLCIFLYKQWQKKKREEQYARLLRLFEEDDELELELGLRD